MTILQKIIKVVSTYEVNEEFDFYDLQRELNIPFKSKPHTFVSYMKLLERSGYVFRTHTGNYGLHDYIVIRPLPPFEKITIKTFKSFSDISVRDLYERKYKLKMLLNNENA